MAGRCLSKVKDNDSTGTALAGRTKQQVEEIPGRKRHTCSSTGNLH